MPKISEAKREERRAEIMAAALRCFGRSGYQRTTMADIISESGLSAGAIYLYFSGKQELLKAVAERVLDDRRAELSAAGQTHVLSPAEIVRTLASGVRANAPLDVLIQTWGEATVDPELRAILQGVLGRVRATVSTALTRWAEVNETRLGMPAAEWAGAATPILMSIIPGFALQLTIVDDFDEKAFLGHLTAVLPHP
ncbi:TetR/AcrR family transcriptional regulator [Microbacterium sp. PAMC22086]|uniref:TetR/AcrR family transcriptional regulator n=1 Tax=Microbacterium sp. PAMC22086 TaxID=2861281 RepID=UPI001C63990D|nr:TetR/AcrR family transcriptional regulator [Microbacterium sp. PAMC22086]QYG12888.1 TetR/AcrR family transcriptional regulator [Microbacterium sp. PAMC22086]